VANLAFFPQNMVSLCHFLLKKNMKDFRSPFFLSAKILPKQNTNTNYRIYFLSQKNHCINYLGENSYDMLLELL
jgi:hypothetical protein